MKIIFIFVLAGFLLSCESKNIISINVDSENTQIDSLYIIESITEKILFRIPVNGKRGERMQGEIEYPTTGSIQTKDGKHSILTILRPNKELTITIGSDSSITNNDLGDSLLNYLWKSNNEFIANNAQLIFTSHETDSIIKIFQDFEALRRSEIEKSSPKLSFEEREILLYQNSARIHSFLFYFGRLAKDFPANHKFFSFIEDIDNNTRWAKTLPQNLLYKHEINYLALHDSIESVESFISYVSTQTENKDLLNYLKATYLTEIIQRPSYWQKHERHLNAQALKDIIASEKSNKYNDIISQTAGSFFSSQKGVKAYDFEAHKVNGSKVKLSDFKGKVVFIDSWATWCGPCIAHRPRVLELAKKYADNEKVKILMISLDSDEAAWIKFLNKKGQSNGEEDLIIRDGMKSEYGDRYNVKQIPKYMLINKDGIIINSNIPEPSIAVEEMIEYELKKM